MSPIQTIGCDLLSLPVKKDCSRQRRCFVSHEKQPVEKLVRFVVSPDNKIVPDIEHCLPGRGLWLKASRDIVERACNKQLFEKNMQANVEVDKNLIEVVEELLVQQCLNLIGLARRAGEAVAGFEKMKTFLSRHGACVVFCAYDITFESRQRMIKLAGAAPVVDVFSSMELGRIFNRKRTVYVAVVKKQLGTRLLVESTRLAGFRISEKV